MNAYYSKQPGRLAGIRFANRRRVWLVFWCAGPIGRRVNRRFMFLVGKKWNRSRVRRHFDVGIHPLSRDDVRTESLANEISFSHRILITRTVIPPGGTNTTVSKKNPRAVNGFLDGLTTRQSMLELFPNRIAEILDRVADLTAGFSESLLSAPGSLVVL